MNGRLFTRREEKDNWKLIFPKQMVNQLIKEIHECMGHPGRYKTLHILLESCTFKNMNRTIAAIIKQCDACQRNKPISFNIKTESISHKPKKILEKISDLIGPLPTGRGGTHYILAILDIFSKYIKLYAVKKTSSKAIINIIENKYIPELGTPEVVLTDNRTQFLSKLWKKK